MTDVNFLNETLDYLLNSLTAREARILRLRYGFVDGQTRTLQEVGEKLDLSRPNIGYSIFLENKSAMVR